MADLYHAAESGKVAEVQRLLEAQADVTYKLPGSRLTPLHAASENGHTEIVKKMLIRASAPLEAKNIAGDTPLHSATRKGHTEVAEMLISAGAPLDAQDILGQTPLHLAVIKNQYSTVLMLIASGARADIQDKLWRTPSERTTDTALQRLIGRALLESKYEIQVPLDRIKVFLCGDGAIGKSTLARALQRSNLSMMLWDLPDAVDERTHGFNSFPAAIPTAGACTIVDFAGQPEYWAPSAVFMGTVSGVFVVLCKLTDPFEKQFEQLRYWVRFIGSQSRPENKPRVVLVGTHRGAAKAIRKQLEGNTRVLTPLEESTLKASLSQLERISKGADGRWECAEVETYVTELHSQLGHLVDISPRIHYVDSVSPAKGDRAEMASLRKCLDEAMADIRATRTMPKVCADVIALLPAVRMVLPAVAPFDAVQQQLKLLDEENTIDCDDVNRMKAVLGYLSETGHAMYYEDIGDMVVVDPQAFGTHIIGQLFCPVAKEGFTPLLLTGEDGLHFRQAQLETVLSHARTQGHIFGNVAVVLGMLTALELIIPLNMQQSDLDGDDSTLYAVPGRLSHTGMDPKYLTCPDGYWDPPLVPTDWHYIGVRLAISESQLMIPPSLFPRLQHRLSGEPHFKMWRHGLALRELTATGKVAVEGIIELHNSLEHMDVCVRSETGDHSATVDALLRMVTACEGFDVFFTCSIITSNSMMKHVQGERCCEGRARHDSDRGVKPSEWIRSRFEHVIAPPEPDVQAPLSVVVSCPHTMSLSNTPPFFPADSIDVFDVFEHCQRLQRAGRLKMAFDRPGTSTVSPRDAGVVWSMANAAGTTEAERWAAVKESVARSGWFEGFQTRIKASVMSFVQDHPEREIHLLCIQGGPISELESEAMSRIVREMHADMKLYQIHSRITIELVTYSEFVAIFGDAP